jgi:fructosamine-3-kinase
VTFPAERVAAALGREVAGAERLGGGSIAAVWRVTLADGDALVVKLGRGLALEGWMLRWLAAETTAPVPRVRHAEDDLLAMDHVDGRAGVSGAGAEADLAAIVAALHARRGARFGFERDTVIGGLPQPNPESGDWTAFFRDQRLLLMAREALAAGRLPMSAMMRVERLASRLERWLPASAVPALVHGDLWHGNVLSRGGRVVVALIDPALYFADAEIELAFMTLFGSVGDRFFAAYAERRPIAPGFFEERRALYNLYPLLVHVRLFGGHYVGEVEATLARFGC